MGDPDLNLIIYALWRHHSLPLITDVEIRDFKHEKNLKHQVEEAIWKVQQVPLIRWKQLPDDIQYLNKESKVYNHKNLGSHYNMKDFVIRFSLETLGESSA